MTKKPTKRTKTTDVSDISAKKAVPTAVTKKSASPKPASTEVSTVVAAVVTTSVPTVSDPALKKKDLVDQVVLRSGFKKKEVKPIVEATLAELGRALAEDRELNLPPFAKLKVQKVKELSNARVTIARLRQPRSSDSLAD